MKPPVAKTVAFDHTLHGDVRHDDYHWLRDDNWQEVMKSPDVLAPEIRAYLDAENAYTDEMMRDTAVLRGELFAEMKGWMKDDDQSVPFADGPYAYFWRYRAGGQHPVYCRTARAGDDERVLVDGDALSEGHSFFDIGGFRHSPDHRLVSYVADTKGSEYFEMRFIDAQTGAALADAVPDCSGAGVWSADSAFIFYVRLDDHHRPSRVFRHRLGAPARDDILVYEEKDPSFYVGVSLSESGRLIFINIHDHQTTEIWTVETQAPEQAPRLIAARRPDVEYSVSHRGEMFFILTNADGAEDFKIVVAPVAAPEAANWRDVCPHAPGTLLLDQIVYEGFHVSLVRTNALPQILIRPIGSDGRLGAPQHITFDEDAYDLSVSFGYEFSSDQLRFSYSSPTTPRQTVDYTMTTGARALRKTQEIPSGHDPADYRAERLFIPAGDGAEIPVTLLYAKSSPPSPTSPLLLYGYGSYGHAIPASFSTNRLSLVDHGFVYAIAHIRGGDDKGFNWYKTGKLLDKRNTFTDFIDVARGLIARGMTARGGIVGHGGSAGGMLMGAVANMAPELFAGLIADVPFVDCLTTICDASLPLTPPEWTEWGNPIEDKAVYDYMKSYSPYDNVQSQDYPALLATAGLTDPRVTYWEPAKWIARLRAVKTDDRLCLLKTNMDAGHGGAAGRFDYLHEVAFNYAFALKVAGLN